MNIDPQMYMFCYGVGLLFAGVIVLALITKWLETRRAAGWPAASGIVIRARVRGKQRFDMDGRSHFENEPLVTYEYEVGGKTYRASRLSFAEKISGPEIERALQRYPAGRRVPVYYNPDNPKDAVLERGLPRVVVLGVGLFTASLLGGALLLPAILGGGASWLAGWVAKPENALFAALAGGMGLFSLLLAASIQRQVQASLGWVAVQGRVLSAQSETYQEWSASGSSKMHRARIVYAYSVDGQQYLNDRVSFGAQIGWGAAWLLRRQLEKFPEDSPVTVYYDPNDPSQAVLEQHTMAVWLLAALAAGMFWLAGWAMGLV